MPRFPEHVTTKRMSASRISVTHYDDICQLHRDPAVMKTLSADGLPLDDEATRRSIVRHVGHWEQHGFGLWVFRDRVTGEFLGRGGLMQYDLAGTQEYGLAYAVISAKWNRGLATEMATATIAAAFHHLPCESIASWTLPSNIGSQRVMAKLGFRYEREITFAELPHRFYRLAKTDWQFS